MNIFALTKRLKFFVYNTLKAVNYNRLKAVNYNRLKAVNYNTLKAVNYNTLKAVCLGSVLFAGAVLAQSESDEAKDAEPARVVIPDAPRRTNDSKPEPNGRVFKPSEEISEDSPVPFPVDI